jgi:Flp pilus assembly protein TadD
MQRDNLEIGRSWQSGISVLAAVVAALLTGACSSSGLGDLDVTSALGAKTEEAAPVATAEGSKSDLEKAIEYWGKQYEKNPKDAKNALAYAKNLKAANRKNEALAVLQQASFYHSDNREVASEYGRLALEAGQVSLAQKLLAFADDPGKPDWRVISARGTALAKQGSYAEAVPFFERAAALAPSQASVQNNLAMAYAANGEPAKAEEILRRVVDRPTPSENDSVVRQNLALVVGLQGKYTEARTIAASTLPAEAAAANVEYVRNMVRIPEQKPAAKVIEAKAKPQVDPGLRSTSGADTQVAAASPNGWDAKVASSK